MGFLGRFLPIKQAESVVLIDIAADSVAGAYARFEEGRPPVLLYAHRLFVEVRPGEPDTRVLARALATLGEALIREGAPALVRSVGDGRVHHICVSVGASWQKALLRTELFEQKIPFTFTKHLVSSALEKAGAPLPGYVLTDTSIIGVVLNGYETRNPYGKRAHRAAVITLSSFIDETLARKVRSFLRNLYHTRDIAFIAASSLRYQAVRSLFPHEQEMLVLDANTQFTSAAVIRGGLLVDVVEIPAHISEIRAWQQKVHDELARLAEKFPLPRTIFLCAPASGLFPLREAFDTALFGKLWLSDNPPTVIPILPSHVGNRVRQGADTVPDTVLLLMALYCEEKRGRG